MSLHTNDIWVDVPVGGWSEYYEINPRGMVRNKRNGKVLKSSPGKFGYHTITLKRSPYKLCVTVHSLVLKTFGGPPPSYKHETCHIDGNKSNNNISNLRWGTRKENHADKIRHGTTGRKFTPDQVSEIKDLLSKRLPHYRIARKFNVSAQTITNIATGKSYAD